MATQINIHSLNLDITTNSPELIAAQELKNQLEIELQGVDGIIDILTNVKYPGGATSDIDILVFLDLHNYGIKYQGREIDICKLVFILELKEHPINKIRRRGIIYDVHYKGGWKNASAQSETQNNDLRNYITSTWKCPYAPFIYNFIWFHGVNQEDIDALCGGKQPINDYALPHKFTLVTLLQQLVEIKPVAVDDYNIVNSFWKIERYGGPRQQDIVHHFTNARILDASTLTQKRLNLLSAKEVQTMIDNEKISQNQLTVFKGRAGTGKTIKILQYAIHLHNQEGGKRCLLLTYNQALVGDIRRLLFLCGMSTKIDQKTVQIQTLHSFFLELMYNIGTRKDRKIGDPESYYSQDGGYIKDLDQLGKKVGEIHKDSSSLYVCENPDFSIDWDYVLIDEAQDWLDLERDILYQIYGSNRVVVADGVDQFMRGHQYTCWTEGIVQANIHSSKHSLRQKASLLTFVNAFSDIMKLSWKIEPNHDYIGGCVDIMKGYNSKYHISLLQECELNEAKPYDILFLVPPTDVKDGGGFIKYDLFEKAGIKLFDGTIRSNRERYSTDVDCSRIYQYDSCRGLEGWCVICYDFDLLYNYKYKQYLYQLTQGQIQMDDIVASNDEKAKALTALWLLMPLTRAIHHLVITLHDPNCEFSQQLKKLANTFNGIITWYD